MCCMSVRPMVRIVAAPVLGFYAATANVQSLESTTCSITDRLQGDLEVHHVGAYAGTSDLGAAIELDNSGHDVRKVDVLVNLPGKHIVLVASAYDPVVWNVAWTPGTSVVGALVSGHHGQAIVGISKSIPLYLQTHSTWRPKHALPPDLECPIFHTYSDDSNNSATAEAIRMITGRSVTQFYQAPREGIAVVGDTTPGSISELISSPDYRLEEFVLTRKADEVPAGRRGLDELVRRGFLRRASPKDIQDFEKSGVKGIIRGLPVYVVLKPVALPDGLYGANAVSILVPEDVPMPTGPPGHNWYFQYGQGSCIGLGC